MVRVQGELVEGRGPKRSTRRPRPAQVATARARVVAVLGGGRGTSEDAYVVVAVRKASLGTDNVDCQLGDGSPPTSCSACRGDDRRLRRAVPRSLLAVDLRELPVRAFLRLVGGRPRLEVPDRRRVATRHSHARRRRPPQPSPARCT
jgi:hypothetical protein